MSRRLLLFIFWSISSIIPHFVFAQLSLQTVVQQGHSAAVKAAVSSNNKKLIATASRDKSVKVWDAATGMEIMTLFGHTHTVNDVQFSPNDIYLATSSADNTVALWNVAEGKMIWRSQDHDKYSTAVTFSPDGKWMAYGGYYDSVYVVSVPSGKEVTRLPANADQGSGYGISLDFSPDNKWLAVGEDNKTVKIYSTSTWMETTQLKPEKGWCGGCGTDISFSQDSKYLAKMSHNEPAQVYSMETKKTVSLYAEESDELYGIYITNQKVVLAHDSVLQVYSLPDFKLSSTISTKKWQLQSVHAAEENMAWLALSDNKAVKINITNGGVVQTLEGFAMVKDNGGLDYDPENYWERHMANYLRCKNKITLSPNEQYLFTGKIGKQVIGWNTATGAPDLQWSNHEKAVIAIQPSKDGKYIVAVDGAGYVYVRESATGKLLKSFKAHREPIFDVTIHPNGTQIATASWDATIKIWNWNEAVMESVIDLDNQSAYTISYTPDGLYLVVGQLNNTLSLIEPDSKKTVRTFVGHTGIISSIRFGKDRNQLVTSSWDGTTRSWELSTGMMLQKFKSTQGKVHAAVFMAYNTKIITAGEDRVIRIWNVADGKLLLKLTGHNSEITDLQINADNKILYSYSVDGVIKCWNLETNKEIFEHIHLNAKEWMATTPEGYFVATQGARNNIHFTKGLEVYTTDQFFDKYYKPDLIQQSIKSRGMNPTGGSIQGSIEKFPPPTVKVGSILSSDGMYSDVSIKVTNTGGGIQKVKLFHNGKLVQTNFDTTTYNVEKDQFVTVKHHLPLIKGHNHFSATAQSKAGIESLPGENFVFTEKAPHAATCHVLVIGVNDYQNPVYQLNYARQDAEAFATELKKESKDLFEKVYVHKLLDKQVTKQQIIDTLKVLQKQISYNDVFILYYAGHGSMVDGMYYFITADCARMYDVTALQQQALSATEMQQQLAMIKALKQIIIIDACQSGGSVEVLAMRGVTEEKAFAQLSRSVGIHVMAAAAGDQAAKEVGDLKHGLFTYVLLKGMSGDADGAPQDGKITVYELKSYLDDQVPEWSSKYGTKSQYPYTFSRGGDFPIILK
jgi:WD40 repeat protein